MASRDRIELIQKNLSQGTISANELLEKLEKQGIEISKITLNRDLKSLESEGLITREGESKATKYKLSNKYKLLRKIDFQDYFSVDSDDRKVQEEFNFEIFPDLLNLFSKEEKMKMDKLNAEYQFSFQTSSQARLKKELERFVIDLSWKSSKLEGNTYTLLETEKLIKEEEESKGHDHDEATMILNHKKALDYVLQHKESFKEISVKKILKIHSLLVKDLGIVEGLREKKVGIIGTKYKPLKVTGEIKKALEKLCEIINQEEYPQAKALLAVAMMSYIQTFEDGNKRTARILSTAILLAYDYCPLSYRNVDDYDYKKSVLLFYEQNNIYHLKHLFMDQFEFSVGEYF